MRSKMHTYHVILRPEPEGGYTAVVPALPGCVSYGKTVEEANRMIADAIDGYIASMRKRHETIPSEGTGCIIATATVAA